MAIKFNQINWFVIAALIPELQNGYQTIAEAKDINSKAKAIGSLAEDVVSGLEALTGKDFVNNNKLKSLIEEVIGAIADAQELKGA